MSIGDKGTPSGDVKISQKTVINILTLFIILNAFFCAYLWISHSNLALQFHRLKRSIALNNRQNIHGIPSQEYIYLTQTQDKPKNESENYQLIMGLIAKNKELQRRLQEVQKILYPPKIKNKQYKQQLHADEQLTSMETPDSNIDSFDNNIINSDKSAPNPNPHTSKSFDSFDEQINIISQKSQGDTLKSAAVPSIRQTVQRGFQSALGGLGQTFLQLWSAIA